MTKLTKIAAAGAIAAALALPSSQAFAATKTESALIGAAIGALAGGLIGNGDTTAVVAGAAVGGLVGAASDNNDRRGYRTGSRYRTVQPYQNGYGYSSRQTRYVQPSYRGYDQGYDNRSYDRGYDNRSYDRGYVPTGYRSYGY